MDDFAYDQTFSSELGSDDDLSSVVDELPPPDDGVEDLPFAAEFDAAMTESSVLGDMEEILGTNPAAVRAAVDLRLIQNRVHVLAANPREQYFRDWQVDTGQVFGPAGAETTITIRPQCRFRCEKIMATDDVSNPGTGTRILSITIGNKVQKVGAGGLGSLTQFFSQNALANGIKFDTADPWASIAIRVLFVQQCNFEMTIFGTAEVEHE